MARPKFLKKFHVFWKLQFHLSPFLEISRWPIRKSLITRSMGKPQKILIATVTTGNLNALSFDYILASGLRALGHDARMLSCRGALSACMVSELRMYKNVEHFESRGPSPFCGGCSKAADLLERRSRIPIIKWEKVQKSATSSEVEEQDLTTNPENADLTHAIAGAVRFLAANSEEALDSPVVMERFTKASITAKRLGQKVLKEFAPDVVVAHHGIYVPNGQIVEAAKSLGMRVVTWNPGYRKGTFIFSHDDTYHKTLISEDHKVWQSLRLTKRQRRELLAYLESREVGQSDWISFNNSQKPLATAMPSKRVALALTNVIWDAQIHYAGRTFPSMETWLLATINWFSKNPNATLIIRVHPAESTGTVPSRIRVSKFLKEAFAEGLPSNVLIVDSESDVSTYRLMELASIGLIYGTKAGVEMIARGIPTVVTGEAWVRGKGLTLDPVDEAEYYSVLDDWAAGRVAPVQQTESFKYAYHYFFRRMIPVDSIAPLGRYPLFRPSSKIMDDNWPRNDPGLMVILAGILNGTDFIFD